MKKKKTIDDLTLMDDYMFAAVMENTKFLRPLLEYILKVNIVEIRLVEPQRSEKTGYHSKGIRLDLYVIDDKGTIYNVEVQTYNEEALPKRMRYYQSVVDISILSPGNNYRQLRKSFIIFICNYDPYDRDRYVYTFENMCREEPELPFGDEGYKVVVNTKGSRGIISKELKEILTYLDCEKITGNFSKELDDAVNAVKANEERRLEYMRLSVRDNEMIAKGREEELIDSIRKMVKTLKLSAQQAMDVLEIPEEDQDRYLAVL